nr:hypothetical protein [uncultured Carboxylicivirga sp.]
MKITYFLLATVFAFSFVSCSDDDGDDIKPQAITVTTDEVQTLEATVSFSEVADAVFYDVELSEAGAEFEYIESIALLDDLTYEVEDLKAGTEYEVKIIAKSMAEKTLGEGSVKFTTTAAVAELVGTWTYTYSDYSQAFTFNADGTGTFDDNGTEQKIKWVAENPTIGEEANIKVTYFVDDYDGISSTLDFSYTYYGEGEAMTIDNVIYYPEL